VKRPRNIDFVCPDCDHRETRLVETNDDGTVIEEQHCEQAITNTDDVCELPCGATCGGVMVAQEYGVGGYSQTINKNNADFAERQRERLEKRSWEHWQKKGRDEAVDRQRALEKKYGA